jgi:hypothetical protein
MNFLRSGNLNRLSGIVTILVLLLVWQAVAVPDDAASVTFRKNTDDLQILVGDRPLAAYVFRDERIPRSYFHSVCAPDGTQVTRNHPPVEGADPTDHATYHPGIWLAFGDISGADFWRNRARVKHDRFVEAPKGGHGTGSFSVQNSYVARDGTVVCREICRYTVIVSPMGHFLLHDSEFFSDDADFVFGDQEEMGLGVRVATPLMVKKGGSIANSDGLRNEEGTWGKQADWCDYSGVIDGRRYGVTLMPHPENFRKSWFHARDYGLLVANPFGRNAFTRAEKSAVPVKEGERFKLRHAVFVYCTDPDNTIIPATAYHEYLALAGRSASDRR